MASAQKSLWELEPDIFTDYEGTISEATFKFNEFGGQFSITVDEIDGRDAPTWENYKLPPGWESVDGGETIQRVAGDNKGIVKSSQFGKLLAAVMDCGQEARDALGEDAPVNANRWIGTRWRFEVTEAGKGKPYNFTDSEGKKQEGVSKDKNYPVEFLGKDSQANTGATNAAGGNGKVDNLSVLTSLNNPVMEARIQELAKTLPFKDWFREGYNLLSENGVTSSTHPDLITAMGTPGLYQSLGGKG